MADLEGDLLRLGLHDLHVELGGKMVPFAGYEMPVQYPAGVMKEHLHTRTRAFDDLDVDLDGVTRTERRDVVAHRRLVEVVKLLHEKVASFGATGHRVCVSFEFGRPVRWRWCCHLSGASRSCPG